MARQIDTDAVINWIRAAEQGSNPASPAASYWYLFVKSDGLYLKDSSGNVLGPIRGLAKDTLWDAAGDIIQGTGANTAGKLAIGTAYQTLRVNSGATALEYVTGGRVLVSEQTPTGTGTVTWSSGFIGRHIEIWFAARSTKAAVTSEDIQIALNNDTTNANYRDAAVFGYALGTAGAAGNADRRISYLPAANAPAGSCTRGVIKIPYFAGTTFNKQVIVEIAHRRDDATIYELGGLYVVEWENAAAVTRVDLTLASGNYVNGSTFGLYCLY